MDYKSCQIFTPHNIVSFMLDEIKYKNNIYGKKIIDNSCGEGNFLVEIVRRDIADSKKKCVTKCELISSIEKNIVGYEIDIDVYKKCIEKMNEVAKDNDLGEINWNIHNGDGLSCAEDGCYDYVVGNPPYIAYRDLSVEIRDSVKQNFTTCKSGKFDYSYAFIEKGIKMLNDNGKMVMITPSNMFKAVFGANLRNYIKDHLHRIIDCSNAKIFGSTLAFPSITIYDKSTSFDSKNYYVYEDGKLSECYTLENIKLKGKWFFDGYCNKGKIRFGDYFDVANSIATLSNDTFIHKVGHNCQLILGDRTIEDGILRNAFSPQNCKCQQNEKIIFPYYYDNGLKKYTEQELQDMYPNAYAFLFSKKEILGKRDKDSRAEWFEFGRSQALTHLNKEKLLISSIVTKKVHVYKLDRDDIPYSGFYITPQIGQDKDLDEATKILNSDKFMEYVKSVGVSISGKSLRITVQDIKNFEY